LYTRKQRFVDLLVQMWQLIHGMVTGGEAGGAGSEDCLKMNIYAPDDANKDSKRAFD
jgi:carboxylesterase type B